MEEINVKKENVKMGQEYTFMQLRRNVLSDADTG